jgi:hypothetical protein
MATIASVSFSNDLLSERVKTSSISLLESVAFVFSSLSNLVELINQPQYGSRFGGNPYPSVWLS